MSTTLGSDPNVVRIAWVFDLNGNNFTKTMLKIGKTHDIVHVVNDQIGTSTYTYDLSVGIN